MRRASGQEGQTKGRGRLATPRARLGVIIPSSNRMIEPQFHRFVPETLGVHFARARITGKWARPALADLIPEIARAAGALADARPDLLVFNCTATSMMGGPEGDAHVLDVIQKETGIAAISTAGAVIEALETLGLSRLTLITPYVQATNDHEKEYFRARKLEIVHDVALGLKGGDEYIQVSPERWTQIALANDHAEAQGFFMSCTNTTQIEAIESIEDASRKPAISANQAVLWACLQRLASALAPDKAPAVLPGRLGRLPAFV